MAATVVVYWSAKSKIVNTPSAAVAEQNLKLSTPQIMRAVPITCYPRPLPAHPHFMTCLRYRYELYNYLYIDKIYQIPSVGIF